ncbi:MAG TPA: Uma2 family endonuclease [Vicinamibacterales bacterium]
MNAGRDDEIVVVMGDPMAAAPRLMTIDDYFATPESLAPTELAFGALRVADSPSARHQSVVRDLLIALDRHVRDRKLGRMWLSPLDVVLDAEKALVVQPDLMFISNERSAIVSDRVRGAPDLMLEVLSPHLRVGQVAEHLEWFARYGVRECWHVHRDDKRVSVIRFDRGKVRSRHIVGADQPIPSEVLPDFGLSLREILER